MYIILVVLFFLVGCEEAQDAPLEGSWVTYSEGCIYILAMYATREYVLSTYCGTPRGVEVVEGVYAKGETYLWFYPKSGSCSGLLKEVDAREPYSVNYHLLGDQLALEGSKTQDFYRRDEPDESEIPTGCYKNDFFIEHPVTEY
jgi:hypothetical protein